ncbi:hypothetical protein [Lactobacillus amylovorus]|uniref:hypothetical protein n=1 Tax=Lactobacillus amylovorus TaxID=1604 RepID=UPI0030EFB178
METIVPSVNTTKEELQERVDYMVNKASQLEQLAETDEHEAMRQFIILKNFANKEYHVLTLQKNEAAVNSNVHLSNYRGFFTHLHFTAGKMPLRLLHWNLDEFHQANIGFRL